MDFCFLQAEKKSATSVHADPIKFTGVLHSHNTAGHTGYLTTASLPPTHALKMSPSKETLQEAANDTGNQEHDPIY